MRVTVELKVRTERGALTTTQTVHPDQPSGTGEHSAAVSYAVNECLAAAIRLLEAYPRADFPDCDCTSFQAADLDDHQPTCTARRNA